MRAERGEDYPIRGSLVKQAIKRQNPGFNERAHGFRAFNELLLEAQKRGLLKLEDDKQAGTYIVHARASEPWSRAARRLAARRYLGCVCFSL